MWLRPANLTRAPPVKSNIVRGPCAHRTRDKRWPLVHYNHGIVHAFPLDQAE